jgi:GH25 family lysozyme M1 (1,4-beta-N-acetylmuramidase)
MVKKTPIAKRIPPRIFPRVIDISHHNRVVLDFEPAKAWGIWGVIHKCTQGDHYTDPEYAARRELANKSELLWAAYHFGDGSDVPAQVRNFLRSAGADKNTMLVLDFEDNRLSNMLLPQAQEFMDRIDQATGRACTIYSGNRLKEQLVLAEQKVVDFFAVHRLWLCQYGHWPKLPRGFGTYWLWQYTGDGVGPEPHNVPGIVAGNDGLDINHYQGTQEQLTAEWAGPPVDSFGVIA